MVHFAVDAAHVKFCTKLDGEQQDFSEVPKWKQMVSDGREWVLERKQLDCSGQEIFQYTATDTTVLYQMSEKLKEPCLKST